MLLSRVVTSFHKTKLKDGKRWFGFRVGPTFSHVQNKIILGLLCSVLGWHLESFTKQNKGNQREIELNAWLWGFSFTLKGSNVRIDEDYIKMRNNVRIDEDYIKMRN